MGKLIVVIMLLLASLPYLLLASLPHFLTYSPTDVKIDCGATERWEEDGFSAYMWELDDEFIKTGQNMLLTGRNSQRSMDTLRYFPDGGKNCYKVELHERIKYILRAGFYYGNYDNLSKPPTFNLELDGKKWAAVTTSLSNKPVFHEVVYITRKKDVSICVEQTQEGQVPFISSLEARHIDDGLMYRRMENNTALYLERRTNYGANQSFPARLSDSYEPYYRFWKPEEVPSYRNYFGKNSTSFLYTENLPPYIVLESVIEAQNVSDSIYLPINIHEKTQLSAYFVLYFYEPYPWPPENETRRLIVYIDGEEKNITVVPRSDDCAVVSIYPVNVTGTANLTISPAEGTTLPPILSAMEVFTTIHYSKAYPLFNFYSIFCVCLFTFWTSCML